LYNVNAMFSIPPIKPRNFTNADGGRRYQVLKILEPYDNPFLDFSYAVKKEGEKED
jgi:hypothetical protein